MLTKKKIDNCCCWHVQLNTAKHAKPGDPPASGNASATAGYCYFCGAQLRFPVQLAPFCGACGKNQTTAALELP